MTFPSLQIKPAEWSQILRARNAGDNRLLDTHRRYKRLVELHNALVRLAEPYSIGGNQGPKPDKVIAVIEDHLASRLRGKKLDYVYSPALAKLWAETKADYSKSEFKDYAKATEQSFAAKKHWFAKLVKATRVSTDRGIWVKTTYNPPSSAILGNEVKELPVTWTGGIKAAPAALADLTIRELNTNLARYDVAKKEAYFDGRAVISPGHTPEIVAGVFLHSIFTHGHRMDIAMQTVAVSKNARARFNIALGTSFGTLSAAGIAAGVAGFMGLLSPDVKKTAAAPTPAPVTQTVPKLPEKLVEPTPLSERSGDVAAKPVEPTPVPQVTMTPRPVHTVPVIAPDFATLSLYLGGQPSTQSTQARPDAKHFSVTVACDKPRDCTMAMDIARRNRIWPPRDAAVRAKALATRKIGPAMTGKITIDGQNAQSMYSVDTLVNYFNARTVSFDGGATMYDLQIPAATPVASKPLPAKKTAAQKPVIARP